ncbi:uncharacterized protein J8A68_001999 [[Candida] subhashii]|uniref:Uncharacterized protein n=1 Tax=[Candida] subhashii TaxID=561895 RepID=A0A8J5QQA4_9ASCO|nr:uncharacterized protein J8A68_001999 [[Candida] subhashii]KAG7664493.1 hypothetical protein J8A68_001999 [[Candida] subhashii]
MGFSISNVIRDPFASLTILLGLVASIISFCGAYTANPALLSDSTWLVLFYEIITIIIIFIIYCLDSIELYKFFLVGIVSIGVGYLISSINYLINVDPTTIPLLICGSGNIVSLVMFLIWLLYFGGDGGSPINQFIDALKFDTQDSEQSSSLLLGYGATDNDESDDKDPMHQCPYEKQPV